ncbi:MAG: P1 family peptidase [Chloroflexales bacterium]|nr:P1 family peptidase [Chloroflexales bacterium]
MTTSENTNNAPAARARDLGVVIGRLNPGPWNAITDVAGVRVGHATLIVGEGALVVGHGPVRTGVTVILPREADIGAQPVAAGYHVLNGNGEMTGVIAIDELGVFNTPVAITNTHSVGVVRDALIAYDVQHSARSYEGTWSLPVVAETYDGFLSDINGFHVRPEHVFAALDAASSGPIVEGCVGGGTGMICHGFKGGIGTSSRVLAQRWGGWTVGVLVQANHGQRALLRVDGVPVGRHLPPEVVPLPGAPEGAGSIIVLIATDAPLLPSQCRRLAQRATIGIGRAGGLGENSSGDIALAFSTAPFWPADPEQLAAPLIIQALSNAALTPLFEAVADATEEAILNALCAATTTVGINGRIAHALPHDRLRATLRQH